FVDSMEKKVLTQEQIMAVKKIKLDSEEFEYGSREHIDYLEGKIAAKDAELEKVNAYLAELKEKLEETEKESVNKADSKSIDKLVAERISLIDSVRKFIKLTDSDIELSDRELKIKAIESRNIKVDSKSDDFVNGVFAALTLFNDEDEYKDEE